MNKEQIDTINIIQEVLRGLVTAAGAMNPSAMPQFAAVLKGFADAPESSPMAARMLQDLAMGAAVLSSAGQVKQ